MKAEHLALAEIAVALDLRIAALERTCERLELLARQPGVHLKGGPSILQEELARVE